MRVRGTRRTSFGLRGISAPLLGAVALISASPSSAAMRLASSEAEPDACHIRPINFEGWQAQEVSNRWVRLIVVPRLGGRLMQVTFAGHPYLFVNPEWKGKYIPPSEAEPQGKWINYGGDKIWPMPEGTEDEQHWPGPVSDALDDGDYSFRIVEQGASCAVQLDGPADVKTGLQYSREFRLNNNSTEILFRATMKNVSSHPTRWSVQSVTQYDTSDAKSPTQFNHNFWAFAPVNLHSAYLGGFHVRSGLADDPSFSVQDGLFSLHWLPLQNEVWIDSPGDWLAVVDAQTQFAMVERFHYQPNAEYPGKASIIFYKNGPSFGVDDRGMPVVSSNAAGNALHYMEGELNSPLIDLAPGQSYSMETEWFPTRSDRDLKSVTSSGIVHEPLSVTSEAQGYSLTGVFSPLVPGILQLRFYNKHGIISRAQLLQSASPAEIVKFRQHIERNPDVVRVSLHLVAGADADYGALGEAWLPAGDRGP